MQVLNAALWIMKPNREGPWRKPESRRETVGSKFRVVGRIIGNIGANTPMYCASVNAIHRTNRVNHTRMRHSTCAKEYPHKVTFPNFRPGRIAQVRENGQGVPELDRRIPDCAWDTTTKPDVWVFQDRMYGTVAHKLV